MKADGEPDRDAFGREVRTRADAQREYDAAVEFVKALPVSSEVCSPRRRCFPPQPTDCLFCRRTDASGCPFRSSV